MDWKTIEMLTNLSRDDKGELLRELVTNFICETKENIPLLLELYQGKNATKLEMLAHKLKGSGFTIGAHSFAQIAAIIENKAREGDLSNLDNQIKLLEEKFIYSSEELKKHLNQLGKEIDLSV